MNKNSWCVELGIIMYTVRITLENRVNFETFLHFGLISISFNYKIWYKHSKYNLNEKDFVESSCLYRPFPFCILIWPLESICINIR